MRRVLLGLILFALVLGGGILATMQPGSDAATHEAEQRIQAAVEEDARVLRLSGIGNLGEIPETIADLPNLVQIDLRDTAVSDLTPLKGLKQLRTLSLRGTMVEDLTPLEDLPMLDNLDIGNTWVQDLEPLTRLPRLRRLDVGRTLTETLEPITRVPRLDWVNLHGASARDGSKTHLETLTKNGVTTNNARRFADDYRPRLIERQRLHLDRTLRRVQLGLRARN